MNELYDMTEEEVLAFAANLGDDCLKRNFEGIGEALKHAQKKDRDQMRWMMGILRHAYYNRFCEREGLYEMAIDQGVKLLSRCDKNFVERMLEDTRQTLTSMKAGEPRDRVQHIKYILLRVCKGSV